MHEARDVVGESTLRNVVSESMTTQRSMGDHAEVSTTASWESPRLDDSYLDGPSALYPAPVAGAIDVLPLNDMRWEDFERLLWRIVVEVDGLREARVYGERGQSQHGIDIVGFAMDRTAVTVQCKNYKRFSGAHLQKAVKEFRDDPPPFAVTRLVVAVACRAAATAVIEAEGSIRADLRPIDFDLWDQIQISEKLRNQPLIVERFFGPDTARRFCHPYALRPTEMPSMDAVAMREALARGPERHTGAAALLEQSEQLSTSNPAQAVQLLARAQRRLTDAGFPGHAAAHDARLAKLLVDMGDHDRAVRLLLDKLWTGINHGQTGRADHALYEMRTHASVKSLPTERSMALEAGITLAESAIAIDGDPFGRPGPIPKTTTSLSADQARVVVLGGEAALTNEAMGWLIGAHDQLLHAAAVLEPDDEILAVRARLLAAEGSDDWTSLVMQSRRGTLGYGPGALVHARYARNLTLHQRFEEADAVWDEAVANACLASRWADAAVWTHSRRVLASLANPLSGDGLWATQTSLLDGPPSIRLIPGDEHAQVAAASSLLVDRVRPAVLAGRRALRHAVVAADLSAEREAHRLLGQAYLKSDEPVVAAHHFARAMHADSVQELGRAFAGRFIDVTDDLNGTNYWTVAYAYRLLAEEADLIPDAQVLPIADHVLSELQAHADGTLVDSRFATTSSRYLNAIRLAAGISERLPPDVAEIVLQHFEAQSPVAENHYRFHDDDEAVAVAGIASTQPTLIARATKHLVPLLSRSQSARRTAASNFIDDNITVAQPMLEVHSSDPDRWASSVLERHGLATPEPSTVSQAIERLTAPPHHVTGVYTRGTGAVADSLLVRAAPDNMVERAFDGLMLHARAAHVGAADRAQYLLAAASLVDRLKDPAAWFDRALQCAIAPTPSELDALEQQMTHPLGTFRMARVQTSRPQAVYLASLLASRSEQRSAVKEAAMQLIDAAEGDYWVTRALQRHPDLLVDEVGYLIGQGWALRSLAAIAWCTAVAKPIHLGLRLAKDPDPRVRRSLATELARASRDDISDNVRAALAQDPCFSVRRLLPVGAHE